MVPDNALIAPERTPRLHQSTPARDAIRRPQVVLLQSLVSIVLCYQILFSPDGLLAREVQEIFILGLLLLVAGAMVLPIRLVESHSFTIVLLLVDTAVTSSVIYISGNAGSDLYLAYFLIILISASARTLKQKMAFTGIITAAYGGLLYLGALHGEVLSEGHLIRVPILLVMGLFYGVLNVTLQEERHEKGVLIDHIAERKRAEEELCRAHDELEARVKERTAQLLAANTRLETDITGRKRAEEELRRVHDELEARVAERTASLALANTQLESQINERKRAEDALRTKTVQLQAITDSMLAFLQSGNWREASGRLIGNALAQTGSMYGFIGVVVEGPVLRILAHEGVVWDSTTNRDFFDKAVRTYRELGYLEFKNFKNLFGRVITSGKAVLSNDPGNDPRAGGLPPGHPPLHAFLGVPILRGTEVVGMIGVANRRGGYTGTEEDHIQVLSQAAGVLYDSYRRREREAKLEEERQQAQEEKARLAEQLRLSQRLEAVGQLAGGIAHDFNNLLTVITGYSQLLLARLGRDDPSRPEIEQMYQAGARAATLTRQLLAFSRKQVLTPKVLNLNESVVSMEKLLQRLIGEHISLVTNPDPTLWRVKADPGQLEQVLMNLAVNARDAMPQGGQLTIETKNVELDAAYARTHPPTIPGPYVMLAVSDTGCGMSPETQAHIFEPFFTTKEQGKGTGLGLAMVYGIIKQSGGDLWVYSEPGTGTTFKVYLPRVTEDPEGALSGPGPAQPLRGSEIILLVEDEDMVRDLARTVLQTHGYTVLAARNGAEALRINQECTGSIHLLLTDMVMPGMSGQETATRLATVRRETKVLYMSGYTDKVIIQHALLDAGTAFLEKPFTPGVLAGKVREVLDANR